MSSFDLALRPSYWASVSGGKDSLFMLNLILHNLDKYPLDGVVHFELEIDYPFIKNVVDYMQSECERFGIRFVRIKPSFTWNELYNKYGFPDNKARWCNSKYKLSAKLKLNSFMKTQGFYVVYYIGYCSDEENRFSKRVSFNKIERYPLVEENISENVIWTWAKYQPIFNHYYEILKRCGCMYCPLSSRLGFAYLYKYYPQNFNFMINKMRETEILREKQFGHPFSCTSSNPKYNADYLDFIIKHKYIHFLEYNQQDFFNLIDF